jgi:hypothetical protein
VGKPVLVGTYSYHAYSIHISVKSTPVADFFIQVFIALLVLPVEEFLRGRITKAAEQGT